MKVYIGSTALIEQFNIEFYKLLSPPHTRVTRRGRVSTTKWFSVRESNYELQSALFIDDEQQVRFHIESSIGDYLVLLDSEFQVELDANNEVVWNEKEELELFYNTTLKGALGTALDVLPFAWIDTLITEEQFLDLDF
jgi:hypothetical protein